MANTIIQLKHSTVTGNVPASLANGEISINSRDGKLFYSTPLGVVTAFNPYPGPSGLDTELQFNDGGSLGGSEKLTFNKTTGLLTVNGTVRANIFSDDGVDLFNFANNAFNAANSNYTSAVTKLNVTNSGASGYLLDQYSGNNPTIYIRGGETIAFNLNVSGHPFMVRVSPGGANYDTGLTHVATDGTITTTSSAQGKVAGTLYWKVPYDIVGSTYVYQCSVHSGMVGNIVIDQPTAIAFTQANTAITNALASSNYANGAFAAANVIQTYVTSANANISLLQTYVNTANANITAAFDTANAAFLAANTSNAVFISAVNLTQNNSIAAAFIAANSAGVYANAAFISANTIQTYVTSANANISLLQTYVTSANANIAAAFAAANSAIATNLTQDDSITAVFNTANLIQTYVTSANANITAAFAAANAATATDTTQNNSITAAFNTANLIQTYVTSANANISLLQTYVTTANANITSSFVAANSSGIYANGAFITANSAGVYANGAFARANNSLNVQAGGAVTGNLTVTDNLTVLTTISAPTLNITTSITTGLGIGGVISGANVVYSNVFVANSGGYIQFSDGSKQYTANAGGGTTDTFARNQANAAFAFANTISAGSVDTFARNQANAASSAATTANDTATSAFIQANAAFNKANTGTGTASFADYFPTDDWGYFTDAATSAFGEDLTVFYDCRIDPITPRGYLLTKDLGYVA